jgi:hypothetical protein
MITQIKKQISEIKTQINSDKKTMNTDKNLHLCLSKEQVDFHPICVYLSKKSP